MTAAGPVPSPVPDPRSDRFQTLVTASRVAMVVATVLALASIVAPAPYDGWAAFAAIGVVVVAPVARVLWLAQRWFRRGDPRFGSVAVGVLVVVALAAVMASL